MSVLNQTFPGNFDPLDDLNGVGGSFVSMGIPDFDIEVVNSSMARITYGNGTLWSVIPSLVHKTTKSHIGPQKGL